MENPLDLTGRVVLVTGGTKGVGRGIAAVFAGAGATVVVCGRSAPEGEVVGEYVECDVRDADAVAAMVDGIAERHGRLDVVVNNAGGAPWAEAATASPRFSESVIRLNLLAPLHVAQAANRVMQQQESGGSIVNITSLSSMRPSPGASAYGAAKAGLLNLTTTLAQEWAPKVRVNAVSGGLLLTEKADLFYGDEADQARVAATVPMGRMGTPDDIGQACLWLASSAASYVSGANIVVAGGGERPEYLSVVANAQH